MIQPRSDEKGSALSVEGAGAVSSVTQSISCALELPNSQPGLTGAPETPVSLGDKAVPVQQVWAQCQRTEATVFCLRGRVLPWALA